MKKWRLIGGVALVFVLGVLAGSTGFHLYERHHSGLFWKDPAERRTRFLQKLTKRLGLTEEQQREFKPIVEDMDKGLETLRRGRQADLKKLTDEGFARMKEKLDPAQRQKLDELRARYEGHIKDRKGRPHFL